METTWIHAYLDFLCGDIFKLLPMKEEEMNGSDSTIEQYLDALIINAKGAMQTFPELACEKKFYNIVNNLEFLRNNAVEFTKWRKTVLNSTRYAKDLSETYGGSE